MNNKNNTIKTIALLTTCAGLGLCAGNVVAETEYQSEFFIGHAQQSTDVYDATSVSGGFIVYFSPVQYGDYPYEEASNMDRHSSVSILANRDKVDIAGMGINGITYAATASYSENSSPVFVDVAISNSTASGDIVGTSYSADSDGVSFTFGAEISEYSNFTFTLDNTESSFSFDSVEGEVEKFSGYDIGIHRVGVLENNKYMVLDFSVLSGTTRVSVDGQSGSYDSSGIAISGKYFFSKSFGVGVSAAFSQNSDEFSSQNGRRTTFEVSKYLGRHSNVFFNLINAKWEDESTSGLLLGLTQRF